MPETQDRSRAESGSALGAAPPPDLPGGGGVDQHRVRRDDGRCRRRADRTDVPPTSSPISCWRTGAGVAGGAAALGCARREPFTTRAQRRTDVVTCRTAASQIGYELVFLIGHPLGWWTLTTDPGWKWLWWQYGLADTRYASGNPWTFGLEVVGVLTGVTVFAVWTADPHRSGLEPNPLSVAGIRRGGDPG